jgi:ribosome biogenesis GTPase
MQSIELLPLGWTPDRAEAFAPHAAAGLVPGRVSLEHNHVYRVLTAAGEVLAEAAGKLKHEAEGRNALPAVGDWVALRPDPSGGRALLRTILPRTSWFSRKAAGRETEEQIVAANIDTVLLVFGMDIHVKPRALERYLVVTRRSGAAPVVVLNKVDLLEGEEIEEVLADAREVSGGAPVHLVSTRTGTGVADLEVYLSPGRTITLLGPSGAGKSSIVNALVAGHGSPDALPIGAVRPWDSRGRHTSVHRQLVVRPAGGMIIDTPGMRELQLWDTDSMDESFADVTALAGACRFRDCRHESEPGCAVKAAVDAGDLDAGRYESFLKLQAEQAATARLRDERAQIVAKRQARTISRAIRAMQNTRDKDRR